MATATTVLGEAEISRALTRISYEIIERNKGIDGVVILGIPTRGFPLAQRLVKLLIAAATQSGATEVKESDLLGSLDITMHRDDLDRRPVRNLQSTVEPGRGIDNQTVILVDDVLFSGRTIRAALDAISDLGRPKAVQLAVLVDRGHRQLPIRADYVGKNLPTSLDERVSVQLLEIDQVDEVQISSQGEA